jgi:hypothetical protein
VILAKCKTGTRTTIILDAVIAGGLHLKGMWMSHLRLVLTLSTSWFSVETIFRVINGSIKAAHQICRWEKVIMRMR